MAVGWDKLKQALKQFEEDRQAAAIEQHRLYAEKLRDDIVKGLQGPISPTSMKPQAEMPTDDEVKNPLDGLDNYIRSVIIDSEGDGLKTIYTVKIDNPAKKDETTGMEIGKIAKAIEFGNRQIAPRPAWRQALNKMRATGIYKKDSK